MSNVLRTFENRLCEVMFKRFLNEQVKGDYDGQFDELL